MNKVVKTLLLLFADALLIFAAFAVSFPLVGIPFLEGIKAYYPYVLLEIAAVCIFGSAIGLYSNIWKYAGFTEALEILITAGIGVICNVVICVIATDPAINAAWAIIVSVFVLAAITVSRFFLKLQYILSGRNKTEEVTANEKNVMIIGAGSAGAMLIREMKTSDKINMHPVCVLDDDKNKIGRSIAGVKIVGSTVDVVKAAEKYKVDEIILAMPSASAKIKSKILNECQNTSCSVKVLPGIYQFATGSVSVSAVQEVSIDDLLGREQVKVNIEEIIGYIKGKTVLVTGGGGSIGSELCRQIALHDPKRLIILDIYENNAYDIQQELTRRLPSLDLVTLIASVRDEVKINEIFLKYKPDIVFHAAAHKHVPLMEDSPNEAIKNNVGGTFNVAKAAGENGVGKFILISTDKAVNPTNVMGATKRICEMIIQTLDKKYATEYVAVRFGNVLGSNGSVIPLFKKQIAEGGPITVTDENIVRYFMTIPEAVSLVLQAGAYAKGGEIFVLDMGEPVRIYDLAVNMIKLSNLEPFKDIDIEITGLRKGEKLYEEKLMAEEGLKRTQNDLILIGQPIKFDEESLVKSVERIVALAKTESGDPRKEIKKLVSTYRMPKKD